MMSLISRKSSATSSGVACHLPSSRTRKRCPCRRGLTGTNRRNSLTSAFLSGSTFRSGAHSIFTPVTSRNAPNTKSSHSNRLISSNR